MDVMESSGHGPYPRPVEILGAFYGDQVQILDFWIKSGLRLANLDSEPKQKIALDSPLRNLIIPRENNFTGSQLRLLCSKCLFESPEPSPDLD